MRLLLDTHILLWWLADDPALSAEYRAVIADANNDVFVSAVSVAEIAIKTSLGKLEAPDGLIDAVAESGFVELPFLAAHAALLRELPWHHRDPFDRMLVCQALAEHLALLSADRHVGAYFEHS